MKYSQLIRAEMNDGTIYDSGDRRLIFEQFKLVRKVTRWNRIPSSPLGYLWRIHRLKKMFAAIGDHCYIEPPFHASWGGSHVHFGTGVYANFNLTLIDDADIFVGDFTEIGPNVTLCTAAHPVHPDVRGEANQYNHPIHIGKHCWIGAGAIILPGVTVGDGSVIGAGAVVTKDVPPSVIVVGVPAKVLRSINDDDRKIYDHGRPVSKITFPKK